MAYGKRRTRKRGPLLVILVAILWSVLHNVGPAIAADDSVPEFFGVYARDGDKLTELFSNKAPAEGQSFSKDVEIIFFRSELQTALGLAVAEKLTSLRSGVFVRQALVDLTKSSSEKPHASQTVPIGRAEPSEPIDVRYAPIAAQPGAVRVRPREPLKPGRYFAIFDKEVFAFTVALDDQAVTAWQRDRCVDRKVLALDEKAVQAGDFSWSTWNDLGALGLTPETINGNRILNATLQPCAVWDTALKELLGDKLIDQCIKVLTSKCVFDAALAIVRNAPDDTDVYYTYAFALGNIAGGQTEAGHVADAFATLSKIGSSAEARSYALKAMAEAQANTRNFADALRIARAIARSDTYVSTLVTIAKAQSRFGDIDGESITMADARKAARAIDYPYGKAVALAQVGDFEEAVRVAAAVSEEKYGRSDALHKIATEQANAGEFAGALVTVALIGDLAERAQALADTSRAQAKTGDYGAANRTLALALETAMTIEPQSAGDDDEWRRNAALFHIVEVQAETGDLRGALQTARMIKDPYHHAVSLAIAGDIEGALKTAKASGDTRSRSLAFKGIAEILAGAGNFTPALETAGMIESPVERAVAFAAAGEIAGAIEIVKSTDKKRWRVEALTSIGKALTKRERLAASGSDTQGTFTTRIGPYPLLSQRDSGNYRDAAFRDQLDTDANGNWRTVKDLACLAAVYLMLERGRGNSDKYIDDGLYDDPRGKEKGGAGAIAPSYVIHKTAAEEPNVDIAAVIAELKEERPSILHGLSQTAPYDHYILVVGVEQNDGATSLIALDPWPGADRDGPGRELRLVVKPGGIFHPTIEGLRFDRMRLIQGS